MEMTGEQIRARYTPAEGEGMRGRVLRALRFHGAQQTAELWDRAKGARGASSYREFVVLLADLVDEGEVRATRRVTNRAGRPAIVWQLAGEAPHG